MEADDAVDGFHCGRSLFFEYCEVFFLTTLHTFASGSSGNAALLSRGRTNVLLDAGISCRRIRTALRKMDLDLFDLSAIFITHTHSDHISGMQTLLKNCDVPVYASRRTCSELAYRIAGIEPRLRPLRWGESLPIESLTVTPFPTSHDAPGSTGYRFDDLGVLTDSGYVTEEAHAVLSGCSLLMLEANHDIDKLRNGSYPYYLKQRILSDQGHLSNEAAAEFAVELARSGTREFLLAHLSAENNTPELALGTVSGALNAAGLTSRLSVAPRSCTSNCYQAEDTVCSE